MAAIATKSGQAGYTWPDGSVRATPPTAAFNYYYNQQKKPLDGLVQSMTGQSPAFQPTDPPNANTPPSYGNQFNPSLGVTASGGASAPASSSTPAPSFSPPNTTTPSPSLPNGYNFNDLAKYEEQARTNQGQAASTDILNTRDNLSKSLADYGKNFFAQENPAILEDLNRRGLFSSPTAVNSAQASALKDIALSNESYLRDFDTSALSARLQAQQDALDAGSNLRSTGLESNIQGAQFNAEQAQAQALAKQAGRNQLNNSLIGGGAAVLGGALPSILAHGAATTGAAGLGGAAIGTAGAGGASAFTGTALAGAGAPASTLFPGGVGAVGTGTTAGTGVAGAGGLGLGGAALGAGAGAALYEGTRKALARSGVNNTLAKVGGTLAPIGLSYLGANKAVSALGGGAGHTANGNAIASTASSLQSQRSQLQQLQDAYKSGQIDQSTYEQQSLPILNQYHAMVNSALSQGSTWANAITPEWEALKSMGLAKAVNGQWISDTGQVIA